MFYIALVVCAISLFIFFASLDAGPYSRQPLMLLSAGGLIASFIFCVLGFSLDKEYCVSVDKGEIPVGHIYCDKCINPNDARNFYAIQHCHTKVDEILKNKNN